jgi:hypothetical protein
VRPFFQSLSGFVYVAVLGTAVLAGCGGGGSTAVPTTTTPTVQNPSGSVPFSSLNLMQPASSTAVNVTSSTPALPASDINDRAPIAMTPSFGSPAQISDQTQHGFAGGLNGPTTSASRRSTSDVAVNSPFDVSYHGGVALGSTVQHNVFINYDTPVRTSLNFQPARFEYDLDQDGYLSVLYQYLTSPGVVDSTPITGRYPKGVSVNDTAEAYASPRPGSSNPYFGQLSILLAVHNAAVALGSNGGSSYGHVYHVFLAQNVDTCFENPLGTPTTSCYSPDYSPTFKFCAYHGSFTYSGVLYLYSVEPYQDVSGCRNTVHNQALPNGNGTVDPADPGYSTLSHELFETISDPRGNAWFNGFSGGNEIGDLCAEFDNFVTVNGNPYVLQSEYSDLNHGCVSANLSSTAQTPQNRSRAVH